MKYLFLLILTIGTHTVSAQQLSDSTCYGSVANGRIEEAVQLPESGKNYLPYSGLTGLAGRNYVHGRVKEIVVQAYHALESSAPDKIFVYGETGWKNGGRIRPHKTHRNGLSVDFMVPVLDEQGKSVLLPTSIGNKYGYGIDFDKNGKFENLKIDFAAIAEHLYQLKVAALNQGSDLALVIIDPPYLDKLYSTKRGDYLKHNIHFMQGKAWIRHDEHYHVNFSIPCKKL